MKENCTVTLQGLIILAKQAIEAPRAAMQAEDTAGPETPGHAAAARASEDAASRRYALVDQILANPAKTAHEFAIKCRFVFEEYKDSGIDAKQLHALSEDAARVLEATPTNAQE